ncbi:M48 family metalloprotease [Streptomyces jumonjinensis]|uniref:Peptidase M48 domain-containing protein n=1 Tax=Streptomyces jumonjinensis TaxID=1945 RepID=A0A646KSG2_STRJU|nr:M48 family metalloprotease [Streptomyces jumonjinensis]MQT04781.1 hypothetical protein [Streptomyces jumonjinensis]
MPTAPPEVAPRPAFDTSAEATAVLALVPKALASLVIMYFLSPLLTVAWLAAGFVAFTDRFEPMAAKLMGLRPPTAREKAVLQAAWVRVAACAGLAPETHSLWVQDTSEINAGATMGRTVAVTRGALTRLQPRELEAVLAHELGHHQRGHARIGFLLYLYGLPVDIVTRFLGRFAFLLFVRSGVVGKFVFLGLAPMLMIFPPTALLLFSWPISRYHSRQGEFAADRFAAELGYGPALHATLQSWLDQGRDDGPSTILAKVLATHPPLADRILRLEAQEGPA